MAKKVTANDSSESLQNEASEMQSFINSLTNLSSKYSSGLTDVSSSISSASGSMSSWAPDDVQTKLEAFVTELNGACANIDADISVGNFNQMSSTAKQAKSTLDLCSQGKRNYDNSIKAYEAAQRAYSSAQSAYVHATPEDKADAKSWRDRKERERDSAEYSMNQIKENLDENIATANGLFETIAGFTFNPNAAADAAAAAARAAEEQAKPEEDTQDEVPIDEVNVAGTDVDEAATMAAGLVPPTNETVESEVTNNGDSDGDGTDNYTEDRHTEQEFEGKDGTTATRTEDLTIEGETVGSTNVPEHAEGNAHYTTTTGETFTGDITIDYTKEGAAFQKNEKIRADATGEQVAEVDTHQVTGYQDNVTGQDVKVTDKKIQQGETVVGTRDKKYTDQNGETTYVESSEWSYKVPQDGQPITEGTFVEEDGGITHTYTYSYNEQGQLIETDSYYSPGTIFGWGKGQYNDTRVVDTSEVYTLKVTNPDGSVTSTPVLMDSKMGTAEVARQYENARMDVGYKADFALEGLHFLTSGVDSVEVTSAWGDGSESYNFELVPPTE